MIFAVCKDHSLLDNTRIISRNRHLLADRMIFLLRHTIVTYNTERNTLSFRTIFCCVFLKSILIFRVNCQQFSVDCLNKQTLGLFSVFDQSLQTSMKWLKRMEEPVTVFTGFQ